MCEYRVNNPKSRSLEDLKTLNKLLPALSNIAKKLCEKGG
jgi:hypothetical protein